MRFSIQTPIEDEIRAIQVGRITQGKPWAIGFWPLRATESRFNVDRFYETE
jgi:hypothetical protein